MEHRPFNRWLSNKNVAILLLKYLFIRRWVTYIFFFGFSLSFLSKQVETTIIGNSERYLEERGAHCDMDNKNDNKLNFTYHNILHDIEPEEEENEPYSLSSEQQQEENEIYIEPDVRRYTNIISREDCAKIIELGEKKGFSLDYDSIDFLERNNSVSQDIEVYNNDEEEEILEDDLWDAIQPYVKNIQNIIINHFVNKKIYKKLYPNHNDSNTTRPKLEWIFLRKYSPTSHRNSLQLHCDTNVFTVNVALNTDFKGGGIFYIKPPLSLNHVWIENSHSSDYYDDHATDDDDEYDQIPNIKEEYESIKWIYSLKGDLIHGDKNKNKTDVIFPSLNTGDALIHNYTVWHAVAPLVSGTRYSLIFFFDMDNPMLSDEDDDEEGDDDDDDDEEKEEEEYYMIKVSLKHEIKECYKGKIRYVPNIDVKWVDPDELYDHEERLKRQQRSSRNTNKNYDDHNESSLSSKTKITTGIRYLEEVKDNLRANESILIEHTYPKEIFRAVRSTTEPDAVEFSNNNEDDIVPDDPHEREVLAEIVTQTNQTEYVLRRIDEEKIIKECSDSNPDDSKN